MTYADAIAELRLAHSGDPWGDTMDIWFSVADEIYHHRPEIEVPAEWQFQPSPLGPSNEPDNFTTYIVESLPDADLMKLGHLANRCASCLKRHGHDY